MIPADHDWLDVVTAIAPYLAFCGILIGYFFARRKNNSEANKSEAETAELYQSMADRAATKALKQEEHIDMQDQRIAALENALKIKDKRIDELEKDNADLRCQVELLQQKVFQLEGKRSRA